LKYEYNVLSLHTSKYKTIAVIGPNATDTILGDYSTKKPKYFVSVLDGTKNLRVPVLLFFMKKAAKYHHPCLNLPGN